MQLAGGITAGFVIDRLGRRRLYFMIAFLGAATAFVRTRRRNSIGHAIRDLQRYRLLLRRIGGARRVSLRSEPDAGACLRDMALGTAWLRFGLDARGRWSSASLWREEWRNVFLIFASGALVAGVAVTLFAMRPPTAPAWRRFLIGDNRASLAVGRSRSKA